MQIEAEQGQGLLMPFQSRAQQRYLYSQHPDVAAKFAAETPKSAYAKLPGHVAAKSHEARKRHQKGSSSGSSRRS